MSNNGLLAIIANIDITNKKLLATPVITTRGYILVNENEKLINSIQKKAEVIITRELTKKSFNFNEIKSELITELMPILDSKTGRVPIILPIIMDVKNME